jgi:hydroxymethylbilane synthase
VRLGTRGSALALAQAHQVAARLGGDVEVVTVPTSGDRDRAAVDKEKWVKELELALLDGSIDVAVHSAKDVPARLPDGLELIGAPPREDPRDALCGRIGTAARIGTSSPRRAAQLRALHEGVEVVELRGNVDTRLAKLEAGEVDGIVLALAGLRRLGREDAVSELLDDLVPAAGQGTVVLEARAGFDIALRDEDTWACLLAERACVRMLGADCHSAVGVHATPGMTVRAWVGAPDGSAWLRDEVTEHAAADPEALGTRVAERLLSAGARELLG